MQDNDVISLRKMAELYDNLAISQTIIDSFRQARNVLNAFLQSNIPFAINGKSYSNNHVLRVFLYGWLAHLEEDKRVEYEQWKQMPMLLQLLENEFVFILVQFLNVVFYIEGVNQQALVELRKLV